MKQVGKKFGVQKVWLLGALMLPLAGCNAGTTGSVPLPSNFNVGINVNDAASTLVVTKKIITPAIPGRPAIPETPTTPAVPAVPGTPEVATYTVSGGGEATFTFGSRAGSDAGIITGYRIIKDILNGNDVTPSAQSPVQKLNIYVQSGYTCDLINPVDPGKPKNTNASCNPFVSDPYPAGTYPGPGTVTAPLSLNLTGGLANIVIATNGSATRRTIVEFTGVTSRGKSFAIQAEATASATLTQ